VDRSSLIYDVVRAVPRGKIVTYGQVAELAGIERGHRIAARALRESPENLCWHRVVGKRSRLRAQINLSDPVHAALQRARLEAEGVRIDESGAISLRDHGWLPVD